MTYMMKKSVFGGTFRYLLLAAAGAALVGCGTSRLSKINDDGHLAEQASRYGPALKTIAGGRKAACPTSPIWPR